LNVAEAPFELEARWSDWRLARNKKGMKGALWIAVCLYPAFGVLDYLVAPPRWLWLLYGTRAAVTVVTLVLFALLNGPWFRRWPNALSAAYMTVISLGISLMTVFMGGLASPYYAGLSLVIVASGLLFVWPPRVVGITYSTIVATFLVSNLLVNAADSLFTAISNQFFLISTAIIAGTGQMLGYRSQREQIARQLMLEKATQNLEGAHDQLKQLDRFKSEFFANITHELKTPLALILAPLGLLIDGQLGSVSDAQRATLQSMQRSGVKLSRLIHDLLDLSKLEESRLRLRIEQQDLTAYLQGLVSQIQPLAQRKNISLTFEAGAPRAELWCDIERLERVFINLLSNATKFTDAGGRVMVRLVDEGGSIRVEVEDTGVGFPSHMAKEVFRRFFQIDMAGTRRFGGAGIGLALAKELVELHGGEIWAEAAPAEGARFSVRLRKGRDHFGAEVLDRRGPSIDRVGGQRESDGTLAEWQLDAPPHLRLIEIDEATDQRVVERDEDEGARQYTVLVVEDTPDVARVIHLALHHDFRILVAGDGEQGLGLARRHRPTIIITDWMMPKMDGLTLTRELRADALTRHIPVVMLTARSDIEDKVEGLETGVNAYLAKPFAATELVSTIRSLLRTQEATADTLLTQKMDSLETIAGGLAHEIRNPLNYLKNALASVQDDCQTLLETVKGADLAPPQSGTVKKLDARMQKMFEVSQAGVKRIASTVDLMVRYSREGYARSTRAYDAFAAVRDVVLIVAPTVSREVTITLDLEGEGIVICVAEELNQVLTNLIQNALEAVASDGTGVVTIQGRSDADHVVLSVKDNGHGIAEAERGRVFDAFYTTKEVGQGLGLGLTITRRVVLGMGGTLSLKSQVGVGSEFIIRVPNAARLEAAG
jgi:signal transduction histidine kinase